MKQISKLINVTKRLKAWWNKEYNRDFATYHMFKSKTNWMKYRKTVKMAKKLFFDNKIQEIMLFNKRPWDIMNWVKIANY